MGARPVDKPTRPAAPSVTDGPAPRRLRRVALVGVSDVVAAGLTALLARSPELRVLGVESAARDLPRADIRIVDILGTMRGESVTRALTPHRTGPVVLAIAPDGRPDLARRALAQGAHGLVSLQWPAAQIVETVLAGTHDRFVRPPALTCTWGPDATVAGRETHGGDMTPRELQVLRLISAGASNDDIARRLFVSVNTVKTYIRSTYRRIGVGTRSQAMLWCFEHGLVDYAVPAAWTDPTAARGVLATREPEGRLG